MAQKDEILELQKSLQKHLKLFAHSLNTKDIIKTEVYLYLAAQLRVLLCDGQNPILINYCTKTNQTLYVYGPKPLPSKLLKGLLNLTNISIASFYPVSLLSKKFKLEEYLKIPLGYLSVKAANSKIIPHSYTMVQLIKWIANKDGICHLDFKKPNVFEQLKKYQITIDNEKVESGLIKDYIIQMSIWTMNAIQDVLATQKDLSVVAKIELIKKPENEIPLFILKSAETNNELRIFANNKEFIYKVYNNSVQTGQISTAYPSYWEKGNYCTLALVYDSSSMTSNVLVNNQTFKQSLKFNLGGTITGNPNGQILKGNHFNFKGTFYLYSRKFTKHDMLALYNAPKNWHRKNVNPENIHKPKSNILKKLYFYFYKKLFR